MLKCMDVITTITWRIRELRRCLSCDKFFCSVARGCDRVRSSKTDTASDEHIST